MNVADESQWDEAVCTLEGCQHPQCWASLRRIERGHPRILDPSSSKSPWETEDKLPTLTIVNITDTCLWTKQRVVLRQPSEFTFPKDRSSLLKPASKRHRRSRKALRDKDVTSRPPRPPKLSVLNLNEANLPFSEDVRNLVVTWVPEETEKSTRQVQKTAVSSWSGKKKRKNVREKSKPSLYYPGRQYSRSPAATVPPPSPVHYLEQLSCETVPLWPQVDTLPQDLLKECILAHEKSIAYPEMKTELSKIRKSLPLEKTRSESAISSKMYLTIHRLTLQRPSLRYPNRLRKLKQGKPAGHAYSGYWTQQKKEETFTKKQGAKKKAKRDMEEQYGEEPMLRHSLYDYVRLSESEHKSEPKLLEEEEEEEEVMEKASTDRHVSLEDSVPYKYSSYYSDYYTSPESAVIYESIYQDLSDVETVMGIDASSEDNSFTNLPRIVDSISWNQELRLLRILQATDEEDEKSHLSRAQSEASLDA